MSTRKKTRMSRQYEKKSLITLTCEMLKTYYLFEQIWNVYNLHPRSTRVYILVDPLPQGRAHILNLATPQIGLGVCVCVWLQSQRAEVFQLWPQKSSMYIYSNTHTHKHLHSDYIHHTPSTRGARKANTMRQRALGHHHRPRVQSHFIPHAKSRVDGRQTGWPRSMAEIRSRYKSQSVCVCGRLCILFCAPRSPYI